MIFPTMEIVKEIRKQYPVGARVRLIHMYDYQAPPVGTKGTIICVDDTGSIHVKWDTGSSLAVVYGEDKAELIKEGRN